MLPMSSSAGVLAQSTLVLAHLSASLLGRPAGTAETLIICTWIHAMESANDVLVIHIVGG